MPCELCTRVLHTGEAKVLVAFTVRELAQLQQDTLDLKVQERLLQAIGLLDAELEKILRSE